MASAARYASRALLRSSFRPAVRSSRAALPSQGFRAASRRGYATEANPGKSSNTFLWAGLAAAGAGGAYFYLQGGDAVSSKPFTPTQADYQKVYDAVAERLADETDYDDGSYGPVRPSSAPRFQDIPADIFSIGPRPTSLARKWHLRS